MSKPIIVKQLIEELKKLPEDMPIIYASDEEGNSFGYSYILPIVLKKEDYKDTWNGIEPIPEEAVCIN